MRNSVIAVLAVGVTLTPAFLPVAASWGQAPGNSGNGGNSGGGIGGGTGSSHGTASSGGIGGGAGSNAGIGGGNGGQGAGGGAGAGGTGGGGTGGAGSAGGGGSTGGGTGSAGGSTGGAGGGTGGGGAASGGGAGGAGGDSGGAAAAAASVSGGDGGAGDGVGDSGVAGATGTSVAMRDQRTNGRGFRLARGVRTGTAFLSPEQEWTWDVFHFCAEPGVNLTQLNSDGSFRFTSEWTLSRLPASRTVECMVQYGFTFHHYAYGDGVNFAQGADDPTVQRAELDNDTVTRYEASLGVQ